MSLKFNIFFIFILFFQITFGQSKPIDGSFFKTQQYKNEIQELYKICLNSKPDAVHRLCLDYMRKNKLRKFETDLLKFCELYKKQAVADDNLMLYRRIVLIEMIQKLKYNPQSELETEKKFEFLFDTFLNENDNSAALECLFEFGQFYGANKNNLQSLKVLFFAEIFATKNNLKKDFSYQGVLHRIGYLLWDLNKPELSTKYLLKALKTGNSIPMDSMVSYNAIGINYQKLNQLKTSNQYFDFASKVALRDKNLIFNTVIKGNQAVNYYKSGQYDLAFLNANLDKNLSYQENLWENAVGAMNLMLKIEIKRNNLNHAKTILDSLNTVALKIKKEDAYTLKRINEGNYLYFSSIKNFQKALEKYKNYVFFDAVFQEKVNKNKISEMQIFAKVKVYKQEMQEKEDAKKIRNLLKIILGILFLIGVLLFLRYLHNKLSKVEKEKNEIARINLEQSKEIEILKIQLLNQLQLIKNENISFQNNQLQQNELETENSAVDLTENSENIQFLKAFNLSQKENWLEFKTLFNSIYPNFQHNIEKKINSISAAESRLLMLHKLGLNSKEIAETLLISPNGVKKAKYRLYKKIGVNTVHELDDFILNQLDVG